VAIGDGKRREHSESGRSKQAHAGRVHRWACVAAACAAVLVAVGGFEALLLETTTRDLTETEGRPSTASPNATRVSPTAPTMTPSTPSQPAVQPAGAARDTSAEDNGNGKGEGNGRSKGIGRNNGNWKMRVTRPEPGGRVGRLSRLCRVVVSGTRKSSRKPKRHGRIACPLCILCLRTPAGRSVDLYYRRPFFLNCSVVVS
jgi:hypothetical protein